MAPKRISFLFALLVICNFQLYSQKLHTPSEILKIMEESEITYEFEILKQKIELPDRSNNLVYNDYYHKGDSSSFTTVAFKPTDQIKDYLEKAETYFRASNNSKARELYLKALELDSSYFKLMTYIAQTYGIEKNYDEAINWYKKSIKNNFIDYMAHWFLSDIYIKTGNKKEALREITIASVLNRNNPRIKRAFDEIYKQCRLKNEEWSFLPQYDILKSSNNKVTVRFETNWMGYAITKAIWKYEPNYRENMGETDSTISIIEEKEALVSLMISLSNSKGAFRQFPEFKALKEAFENKYVEEFIVYEIILPEFPLIAMQIPNHFIESVSEYVLTVRGGKKP